MFRSSKPLIGSPLDRRQGNTELEFTPIGQHGHSADTRKSTVLKKPSAALRHRSLNPVDNSPLKNRLNGGSSFMYDSEYDTIHNSATKSTHLFNQRESSPPIQNDFLKHDLLNNGSNPVRQQQDSIERLQDENYSLKIKLASLTRFVNSITNGEQHEIYTQNSELQEKLIAMRGEFNSMSKELNELKSNSIPMGSTATEEKYRKEVSSLNKVIRQLKEEKEDHEEEYKSTIRRFEEQLEESKAQIDELQRLLEQPSADSISESTVDRLDGKIEDLHGELEDKDAELRSKENEVDELHDKVESLEAYIRELKHRSERSTIPENQNDEYKYLLQERDDKIEKLTEVINSKNSKLSEIKQDLNEAQKVMEAELDQQSGLKSQLSSCQKKIAMLEHELSNVKQTGGDSRLELRKLKQNQIELESEVEHLQAKVNDSKSIITDQKKLIHELEKVAYSNQEGEEFKQQLASKVDRLERELHRVSSERDSLKSQLSESDREIISLRNNNDKTLKAYEELKHTLKTNRQNQFNTKNYEKDIDQLVNKIEELHFQNEQLHKSLDKEKSVKKSISDSYEKMELKSLASKCNELQMELNEKDNEYSRKAAKLEKELNQYMLSLQDKEDELSKLKAKLRTNELDYTEKFDDEKLELIKAKKSKDNQIKVLQLDLESMKEQHESEVKLLKSAIQRLRATNQVDNLMEPISKVDVIDYDLLSKLNDKNSKIKYLNTKLEETAGKVRGLEKIITNLEEEKQYLSVDNRKLESNLNIYADKLRQYKAGIMKLSEMNSNDTEVESLKLELKIKERELEQVNKDFNLMKHDLIERYRTATDDKKSLQNKVEKLISKYRQLQNSTNMNAKTLKKIGYLQDQNDVYRMKYTKSLYNIMDLKFVNSFMVKSIQATNKFAEKDIRKLQDVGIYPDYELICNKKLSLKVLFKFVVAAVRLKRKAEHSSKRNRKIESLGTKLELLEY